LFDVIEPEPEDNMSAAWCFHGPDADRPNKDKSFPGPAAAVK
jgi:hypothetical protein